MGKRRGVFDDLLNEYKWMLVTVPAAGLYTWAANDDFWTGVQVAAGIMVGKQILRPIFNSAPARSFFDPRTRTLTSTHRIISNDPDVASYVMRFKDGKPPDREFVFRGPILYGDIRLHLHNDIPEHTLERFVKNGVRRQWFYYNRERTSLWMTTHGPKVFSKNQILTTRYFTEELRPRFTLEQVRDCKTILAVSGQLINSGQGSAGQFTRVGEGGGIVVRQIVEKCIRFWCYYSPAPHRGRTNSNFFSRFTN